jgi:hypothetical protein
MAAVVAGSFLGCVECGLEKLSNGAPTAILSENHRLNWHQRCHACHRSPPLQIHRWRNDFGSEVFRAIPDSVGYRFRLEQEEICGTFDQTRKERPLGQNPGPDHGIQVVAFHQKMG